MNNFDISRLKNTRIAAGKNFQFRFEAINALNRPNLAAPVVNPTATNFSQVTAVQNYSRACSSAKIVF